MPAELTLTHSISSFAQNPNCPNSSFIELWGSVMHDAMPFVRSWQSIDNTSQFFPAPHHWVSYCVLERTTRKIEPFSSSIYIVSSSSLSSIVLMQSSTYMLWGYEAQCYGYIWASCWMKKSMPSFGFSIHYIICAIKANASLPSIHLILVLWMNRIGNWGCANAASEHTDIDMYNRTMELE